MRSTAETLKLDNALRQSRSIYVSLAIVLVPFAVGGFLYLVSTVLSFAQGYSPVLSLVFGLIGLVFIGAEYVTVKQCFEANRRLRDLRDHPDKVVRPMAAPFQASLFGPYH